MTQTSVAAPHVSRASDIRDAVLSPRGMTIAALVQALVGFVLAPFSLRFDGAIDLHRTWQGDAVPWSTALLDQCVAWPVAAAAAWVALRICRQSIAFVPVLLTFGAARLPLVLVAPIILTTPTPRDLTTLSLAPFATPPASMLWVGLAAFAGLVGFVLLLTLGLRRLTGTRGRRLAMLTVSVLVAAELASKVVLAVAQ